VAIELKRLLPIALDDPAELEDCALVPSDFVTADPEVDFAV